VLHSYEPQVRSTINIDQNNLDAVKKGMLALTTEGSVASYFRDLPVQVGAKTGIPFFTASRLFWSMLMVLRTWGS